MTNLLLLLTSVTLVSGFVPSFPTRGGTYRSELTRSHVAMPLLDDVEKRKSTIPSGPKQPVITSLNSPEEFKEFLNEDDRLVIVK